MPDKNYASFEKSAAKLILLFSPLTLDKYETIFSASLGLTLTV